MTFYRILVVARMNSRTVSVRERSYHFLIVAVLESHAWLNHLLPGFSYSPTSTVSASPPPGPPPIGGGPVRGPQAIGRCVLASRDALTTARSRGGGVKRRGRRLLSARITGSSPAVGSRPDRGCGWPARRLTLAQRKITRLRFVVATGGPRILEAENLFGWRPERATTTTQRIGPLTTVCRTEASRSADKTRRRGPHQSQGVCPPCFSPGELNFVHVLPRRKA